MSAPKTPFEMAQRCAHLMGGNGLTIEQSIRMIAQELTEWKADKPADIPSRIRAFEGLREPYTHEFLMKAGNFFPNSNHPPA